MQLSKLVIPFLLCSSVYAQDYVEITNSGNSYANIYFTEKDGRRYIPENIREEISLNSNEFYNVANGHIGKVVHTFKRDHSTLSVIDVLGNYVIHKQTGHKVSSKEAFEAFKKEVQPLHESFGFTVGVDKYQDVKDKLNKANVKFEERWFKGSSQRPILYVYNEPNSPVINGVKVTSHHMQFLDDRLYSIEFWWEPVSNNVSDKEKLSSAKIGDGLMTGLRAKYLKDKSHRNRFAFAQEFFDVRSDMAYKLSHLWLNNSQHITVTTWDNYPHIKLTYNSTNLFKKARELDLELETKYKKEKEEKKVKENASTL